MDCITAVLQLLLHSSVLP